MVELPKDADGREIPLDTVALYDDSGNVHSIRRFICTNDFDLGDKWINSWVMVVDDYKTAKPEQMYLTKPDSLKQLAEDLNRVQAKHEANGTLYTNSACWYAGRPVASCMCNGCRLNCGGKRCFEAMMEDIINRVNRLCGDAK